MEVLSKDMIRQWILPALPFSTHGRPSVVEPVELVEAILYKLKSGCQWRLLPVKPFFTGASLTWQGVYARFNAWRKDGFWQGVWLRLLRENGPHRLHVRTYGTGGPVVVFESGVDTGGSLAWEPVARHVAPFATAVTYDRAGLLGSERGTQPNTSAAMAQDLHTLLHRAGYAGPYLLVGHSLAGVTLRAFIAQYPHEVCGLVLVDASHPDQGQRFPAAHQPSPPPPLWVVRVAIRLGLVRLFSQAVYPGTRPTDTINLRNNAYLPTSLPAAVEEQRQRWVLLAEARRVTSFGHLPLIVLTGTGPTRNSEYADNALRQQLTQTWGALQHDLLRLSTQGTQQLAPRSEHYVQLQRPSLVTAAIKKLLGLPKSMH